MKTYDHPARKYWTETVPMAEAAGIKPWECVEHCGYRYTSGHPNFLNTPEDYRFALTVLEGRPVFVGSILYANNCAAPLTIKGHSTISGNLFIGECMNYDIRILSWRPTTKKRTFMLELTEAELLIIAHGKYQSLRGELYGRNLSEKANNLLTEASDKD